MSMNKKQKVKFFREYERELNLIVDDIFDASNDLTLVDMASKAGLSYRTVLNLNARKTKLPQLKTVLGLAKAVGMRVVLSHLKPYKQRVV